MFHLEPYFWEATQVTLLNKVCFNTNYIEGFDMHFPIHFSTTNDVPTVLCICYFIYNAL